MASLLLRIILCMFITVQIDDQPYIVPEFLFKLFLGTPPGKKKWGWI